MRHAETPSSPASGVVLRRERDDDRAFLRDLYGAMRAEERAHAPLPDAAWSWMLDQQFELQRQHYRGGFPDAEFWVVELGSRPVGRFYVEDGPLGIRVLDITLLPDVRGRGIGTQLLVQVLERARARACAVSLQVEAGNPARRLYQRLGFRDVVADGPFVSMRCDPPASAGA